MRLCAGFIKALHDSQLALECFQEYPGLQDILNFASIPLGLLPQSGTDLVPVAASPSVSGQVSQGSRPMQTEQGPLPASEPKKRAKRNPS